MSTQWTEDRVDLLKKLWSEGHSAGEIAKKLGDVSRNAVIGKAHRLQLASRPSPIVKTKKVEEPKKISKPKKVSAPAVQHNVLHFSEHICQWPVGDPRQPGFHFCGKKALKGKPYCFQHAKMAYQNFKYEDEDAFEASQMAS